MKTLCGPFGPLRYAIEHRHTSPNRWRTIQR